MVGVRTGMEPSLPTAERWITTTQSLPPMARVAGNEDHPIHTQHIDKGRLQVNALW
jgi:hypothetical protein